MRKTVLLVISVLILLTGCSSASSEIVIENETPQVQDDAAFLASYDAPVADPTIFVYVCGAVESPGVYELDEGSRVIDAVNAAGGILDTADDTYINLAAPLEDGVKLRIPSKEENSDQAIDESVLITRAIEGAGAQGGNSDGRVNINTASVSELQTLPGIGEGIAGKIIKYRDENGSFSRIEDIMKVSGIKDKLFQKIKDKITV